jgi:AraC-like DNA-binding protein
MRPVIEYVEEHMAERVRLADLARVAHLQPTYFSNLFSRLMGVAPMQFLVRRRIARAQAELWRGSRSIKQIAAGLGFVDEFHFSKTFKRLVGVAPSVYRKSLAAGAP